MKNVRYQSAFVRVWLCLFALAYVPLANAQNMWDSQTGWSYVSDGLGGTRVMSGPQVVGSWKAESVPYTGSLPKIANTSVSVAASGDLALAAKPYQMIGGKQVVMDVVAKVPKAAVGAALGRFASKVVPALAVGSALYDLANELGFLASNDPLTGVPVFMRKIDGVVCGEGSPCYDWRMAPDQAWQHSLDSAASSYCSHFTTPEQGFTTCSVASIDPVWPRVFYCLKNFNGTSCQYVVNPQKMQVPPYDTSSYVPATLPDVIAAQQQKSDYGPLSALPRLAVDMVKAGDSLSIGEVIVTGPASVAGSPTSSTTQNPNPTTGASTGPGTSTTTTTKTPTTTITYTGDTFKTEVTDATSSVTTVVNNDNTTTTSTTTSTTTTPVEPAPPGDPCEKEPERIGCSKYGETPQPEQLLNTPFNLQVTAQAFAGGGSCPSPLTFNVANHSYDISYQPICDRLYILKTLFLAMAGVMAAYILADSFRVQ